jgi:hypothetical protein
MDQRKSRVRKIIEKCPKCGNAIAGFIIEIEEL